MRSTSLLWVILLAATGCASRASGPIPALLPTAAPVSQRATPTHTVEAPTTKTPTRSTTLSTAPMRGSTATLTPSPTFTEVSRSGVLPASVEQAYTPDAGPEPPPEWRPPPYRVPLSIHPDDHYWLIRPLPSGSRNYELGWYPYGSDVLLERLAPYRIHHGLDFPNDSGTPILAAADGEVVWAGPRPSARDGVNYYGNTVIIKHDWQWQNQDVYTLYAHTLELFVQEGDRVKQGELLAGVGESGEVSGPHLHLEVRIGRNDYWHTRSPLLWIAPYEGWGTLAGRFVDNRGTMIEGADVTVYQSGTRSPFRQTRTYVGSGVHSDDVWNENFVVPDLPAGEYELVLDFSGTRYRRTLEILPGRTNYTVVPAAFQFVPTPTPTPTLTPTFTETVGITGTLGLTGTVPISSTVPTLP